MQIGRRELFGMVQAVSVKDVKTSSTQYDLCIGLWRFHGIKLGTALPETSHHILHGIFCISRIARKPQRQQK